MSENGFNSKVEERPYIDVLEISGEAEENNSSKAMAILSMDIDTVCTMGKKLGCFLKENKLSGGIMDLGNDLYKFEIILNKENESQSEEDEDIDAAAYLIAFIDGLSENYKVKVEQNFDNIEITMEELEKLLKK